MPGVAVLRSSGQPGSETSGVRIRGFSSANATSALILIDGVEGDMTLLNPNDISTISVLKDAAACAIYGARAAAGVILITTKSGGEGKSRISYNGYFGINTPGNMPERLPAWEEQEFINVSRINASGSPEWNAEQTSWVGNPNFNYRPNYSNGRWFFPSHHSLG
ncbi:MAG: TonB-dependent receptor plug domain-containing protein [Bacteroides graminisolvens]